MLTRLPSIMVIVATLMVGAACSSIESARQPSPSTATTAPSNTATTAPEALPDGRPNQLLAVGDMANCANTTNNELVALAMAESDAPIAALGDLAYPTGSVEDFEDCFDSVFGALRDRFRPVPGNHEYMTEGADPFFDYFADGPGERGRGWYVYDVGDWQVFALNSNCGAVGGCDEDSPQYAWLSAELEADPERCRIAYWHHPRFTSSEKHIGSNRVRPLVELLHEAGTEAILAGHAHQYERFARLDPFGTLDPTGPRYFNVGTGGTGARGFGEIFPGSESRGSGVFGVLELTLEATSFTWSFEAVDGSFSDQGSDGCRFSP